MISCHEYERVAAGFVFAVAKNVHAIVTAHKKVMWKRVYYVFT